MGFFQCFQRRSKAENDDLCDPSAGKRPNGRRTRSNSSVSSDDDVVDRRQEESPRSTRTGSSKRTPKAQFADATFSKDDSEYEYKPQLSRITEEATVMSMSSVGGFLPKTPTSNQIPAPPAREAAFHGPPRYDWMDIETTAATKIQSIYRRNKVMGKLEKQGYSTSAIRNRRRRRIAKRGQAVASEDVPSLFSCCAVGLAFGEATEDDDQAYRDYQKKQYEERVKQQAMHEDALRKRYLRNHGTNINIVERIEVVE